MLRSSKDLQDLAIVARDGTTDDTIGDVKDLYFDDDAWAVRYLVVETGSWLFSRKVLISPIAAGNPDWTAKRLPVSLTREQIKNSPDIDTDMPVTRQHETDYLDYFSYPYYWDGPALLWGRSGNPMMLAPGEAGDGSATAAHAEAAAARDRTEARESHQDPHLRSCKAVVGYAIEASDGEIGQVQGLLVDEDSWAIRYLVVSTGNWWKGHEVLVAPRWIQRVSWAERSVTVDLTLEALKQAPWYDPASSLSREMEVAVFMHHGRTGYWPGAASVAASASDLAVSSRNA
jgi:uncharacterized protein YrrD